jgi:mRNA-degrading endonuclease YafQ of YafQ-DinJ toxin-antitoxin module
MDVGNYIVLRHFCAQLRSQGHLSPEQEYQYWLKLKEGDDLAEYKANKSGTKKVLVQKRAHEQFARGFEQYLREGTAPSPELASVFAKFKEAYPLLAYKPDHNRTVHFDGSREIHAYFDTVICPKTKRYLSEDYMFCQWVRNIGIDIWLCPWMKLKHTGTYIFGGSMEDLARLSHAQADAGSATAVPRSMDEKVIRQEPKE